MFCPPWGAEQAIKKAFFTRRKNGHCIVLDITVSVLQMARQVFRGSIIKAKGKGRERLVSIPSR
jgi:hypothetical protein